MKSWFYFNQTTPRLCSTSRLIKFRNNLDSIAKYFVKNGSLKVIPESHKKGFIKDSINWKNLKVPPNKVYSEKSKSLGVFKNVDAKLGEVLLFSTFLVHKSGLNLTNNIRYSINIRFNDLYSQDYAERNYYLNEISGLKKLSLNFNPKNVFKK